MDSPAISNSQIDKAGKLLLDMQTPLKSPDQIKANALIDQWRQSHLQPLTDVTLKLQEWLSEELPSFCIAQRLKRKPQIIKKLQRSMPMRLSQMQDIGGCRAIFENDRDLSRALDLVKEKSRHKYFEIVDIDDYREHGRPESGYRALHIRAARDNQKPEIQFRTLVQHAWAEEVERDSVICRQQLKEGEGPTEILMFLQDVSQGFHYLDRGLTVPKDVVRRIEEKRRRVQVLVGAGQQLLGSGFLTNRQFVRAMEEKERQTRRRRMNNWLLIFNWSNGTFEHWNQVETNPEKAAIQYSEFESQWSALRSYEVVLIGARQVSIIEKTHSHYFGANVFDQYLAQIGLESPLRLRTAPLSRSAAAILQKLVSKGYWGSKRVSLLTLKNHYCHGVDRFDEAIDELIRIHVIPNTCRNKSFSLNIHDKAEVETLISSTI